MPLRASVCALVASGLVTLVSCEVPPRTPTNPGQIAEICRAACDERQRCSGRDVSACEARCAEKSSPWVAYLRPDYVTALDQCYSVASCERSPAGQESRRSCIEAARPTPTKKAEEVCSRVIGRINDCGHWLAKEPYDTSRCLKTMGLLDDGTLDAIGECTNLTCRTHKKYSPWDCIRDIAGGDQMP